MRVVTVSTMLVLLHTMDPRGTKLGGIETHIRLVLARHPLEMSVLFVGIDEGGDLALGRPVDLVFEGRPITFLPVAHVPSHVINKAAKSIAQSTTLHFALGLLRYLRVIRAATRQKAACCEIERYEFALVPKLLRLPLVVVAHNEGTSKDEMDSLLKRYWWLHLLNERLSMWLADRIFAVNPSIKERIGQLSLRLGAKTEVMSVSVNTEMFVPTPFDRSDDVFHIGFAGRLDAFKDPGLIFATIAKVAARLTVRPLGRFRRVAFDYIGASDPTLLTGFDAIAPLTVRHGIRSAFEVATLMRNLHSGIIASFFEGMPCYLLEMLASGRPVAAIRLPQFDPLIVPEVSGSLVERRETAEASADALAEALLVLVEAIDANLLDPRRIADLVHPYSVGAQMHRLFACHEALAMGKRLPPAYGSESISSV